MRPCPLLTAVVATLLIVSVVTVRLAGAQSPGESYWGEHTLNGLFQTWPVVALVVFGGLLAGGVFGLYELDTASLVFLLAGLAFLVYHVYGHPAHRGSPVQSATVIEESLVRTATRQ